MKKRILVTGGAGFIGSHQTEYLLQKGFAVRVIDDLSTGQRDFVAKDAEFLEGSILDKKLCEKAVKDCDAVIHLAAMSKVGPSMDVPELCVSTNVMGTLNLLMAAKQWKTKAFVYAGSSTYYGLRPAPHSLNLLPDCLNPYAASKYMGEMIVENFHKSFALPAMSFRYFNVYGERQPAVGPYALVLGIFLDRHKKGQPLVIFGDGKQTRDFIQVRDVVHANFLAVEKLWSGFPNYEVLNLGTGTNISILELAHMVSPKFEFGPPRAGDARETLADISRTREVLSWKPEVGIREGLEQMVKAHR